MNLSLTEAAIALGQTERQVRYLIKTGRLVAKKDEGGRWVIDSEGLPLSEGQRQAMAQRAATARQAVEKAATPESTSSEKRPYSVNDFQVFQIGSTLFREMGTVVEQTAGKKLRGMFALSECLPLSHGTSGYAGRFGACRTECGRVV